MKIDPETYIGKKYGELTVIEYLGHKQYSTSEKKLAYFKFLCDCGRESNKFLHGVKSGNTKTCGHSCHRKKKTYKEDLVGTKVGRLTVISFLELSDVYRNGVNRTIENWECLCECGESSILTRNKIVSKSTLSCGCLLKEKRGSNPKTLDWGVAAFNDYYSRYKASAAKKKLSFELDKETFRQLIKQNCYYCDTAPFREFPSNENHVNGQIIVNGIDRVDNDLGYTKENTVSCCSQCNKAKLNQTLEDFLKWIERIQKTDVSQIRQQRLLP